MAIVDYAVGKDEQWAKSLTDGWMESAAENPYTLAALSRRLHQYYRHPDDITYLRAFSTIKRANLATLTALMTLQARHQSTPAPALEEQIKALYHSIDGMVRSIDRAIDRSAELEEAEETGGEKFISREKIIDRAIALLKSFVQMTLDPTRGVLLAPTAHHIIQCLSECLDHNPADVLELAGLVVASSKRFNYTIDSLAMNEIVKLVERLLADHRAVLLEERLMVILLEMLDAFVQAGWPEALNLVWRLDEVYR